MLAPGTKLGPYEIVAIIGAGGMGEVYRARDARLGRDVALKVLLQTVSADDERVSRFHREAQVLASLNHPNIAAIYGFEDSGDIHALVMELVEGPTLADRIKVGAIPMDEALPIAKQICEAVEFAHEHGIIHRDLKPANIKVSKNDSVKVLDFGLAKALEGETASVDISNSPTVSRMATQAGIILGTAAYMSPEQAKGKTCDRRTDVWAFGCVLYEMLSGEMAFGGETVTDILAAVVRAEPDWRRLPANTPPSIRSVIVRCLKKDPRQRLQAIGDARVSIEEYLSGAQDSVAQAELMSKERSQSGISRGVRWGIAGVFLLAVIAALALAGAYLWPKPATRQTLRFSVNPPEAGEIETSLAISPDGTRLVFEAMQNDKESLWVRPLGSLKADPIAGTEDGVFPFWSPDGNSIGFFAGGKLKRVDLSTGTIQTLASVSAGNSRGGTWGPDGTIVYSPDIATPLMKISASGGTPAAVTSFDNSAEDRSHRWPFFLPDGRHFLFEDERSGRRSLAIEIGSLDSTTVQPILTLSAPSSTAYADGFLLYSQNGSLVAQGFDADHLKITGKAITIAENVSPVGYVGPTGYLAVSASRTGLLAYRDTTARISQLTIVDRSGKTVRTVGTAGNYTEPTLSPDGKKVAVEIPNPDNPGTNSIWLADVATSAFIRFTFEKFDDVSPVWSQDSQWIYFGSNSLGAYNIFRKRADGSQNIELVKRSESLETPYDASKDGRFLLFSDQSKETSSDIWYLPTAAGGKAAVYVNTPAREMYPRFSPDSHWVAYQSDENGLGDWEIFVAPFPYQGNKWQISSSGGNWPIWSDDGRELFFLSGLTLMSAQVTPGSAFQFQPPKPLFPIRPPENVLETMADYSVFPGGKTFLLNQLTGAHEKLPITVVANWTDELKR